MNGNGTVPTVGDVIRIWAGERGRSDDFTRVPSDRLGVFGGESLRPGLAPAELDAWQDRYGFRLPDGLRAWLKLSNGLYLDGPLIHPLSGIGPMVPFGRFRGLLVQPESWFELGNPRTEPVCLDLGYRRDGLDHPVFTTGDRLRESPPRLIAAGFDDWLVRVLASGGAEYWFEPGFRDLGDPWSEHRKATAEPPLPDRLRAAAERARTLIETRFEERELAATLGISANDLETILRHLQHAVSVRGRVG